MSDVRVIRVIRRIKAGSGNVMMAVASLWLTTFRSTRDGLAITLALRDIPLRWTVQESAGHLLSYPLGARRLRREATIPFPRQSRQWQRTQADPAHMRR